MGLLDRWKGEFVDAELDTARRRRFAFGGTEQPAPAEGDDGVDEEGDSAEP